MKIAVFDTDLTDAQWNLIRPMLPKPSTFGRPPTDRRRVLDAIFDTLTGGGSPAGKRIKGRKRHLLVDSMGLLLCVVVTPARMTEREGGRTLLGQMLHDFTSPRRLWADGGYARRDFAQPVRELRPKLEVEIVKRCDDTTGFKELRKRWVVERTFGWIMEHRRLAQDYERTESSAEAWVYLAMIRIQLRRLA